MNEQNSMSELLCAFLDGELEGTEAETLFYMLAHDQELQTEMRRLIALNAGFRKELLTPPERLFQNIEQRIAHGTPADAAALVALSSPSRLPSLLKSRPFLMIASAVCAVLLTLQLSGTSNQENAMLANTAAQSMPKQQQINNSTSADNSAAMAEQKSQQENSSEELRATTSIGGVRQQWTAAIPEQVRDNHEQWQDNTNHEDIADGNSDRATTISSVESISSDIELLSSEIEQPVMNSIAVGAITDSDDILPADETDPANRQYALHLRGFSARSYPDFDVDPLMTPTLNNISIGLSYQLADEHSIGVEVGQENLLQRYYDTEDAARKTIEQNYLAFWAGATYRFSPNLGGVLQPYAQTFIGGVRTGPMTRALLGVEYRTGALGIGAGVEGTLHLYRYRSTWYSISKLGITYSLSFHF